MKLMMTTRVTVDYPKVPEDRRAKIRALLKIQAESPPKESRRPLNIGVVLDRSGSMHGPKIHHVREATKALADKLGADDRFSLTIFDQVIETVIPPRRMGDGLGALRTAVDGIEARGNTNLCGGYQAGIENVLGKRETGALDRVLLLTDGLANVGITDPGAIASLSSEMAERGIVTSTVGVGADYCEALLGRMAQAGGGNTYFLQSATEIDAVLEEELGGLLALAAEGLKVRFKPGVEGVQAVQLNTYRVSSDGAWVLGDVYGSQSKALVLELELPPMALGKKVRCGTLHLTCTVTSDGGTKEFTESLPVDLDVVPEKEFAAQGIDPDVTLQAAELLAAAARVKAWDLAARQDFAGAAKALNDGADGLGKIGLRHPTIEQHVAALRTEAHRLATEEAAYYTPLMRKSMYYDAYYASHGKSMHRENMRARHAVSGAGGCHTFPLEGVNGHPVAQIGTRRYLVDTGRPQSIGDGSPLLVGARSFDLETRVGIVASLCRDIGAGLSGILGADILGKFDVGIGGRILVLDENPRPLPGRVVKADFGSGVPVLSAQIGGLTVPLALSTGKRISFLRADLAAHGTPAGRDFVTIPGVGSFETDLRTVEIRFGEPTCSISAGTLPPPLEDALAFTGASGFLGADFLRSRTLGMSARQGIVTIGSA